MKSGAILAFVLLILVAVGHLFRVAFSIELSIGGDQVPVWWSVPAAILFGVGAFLLWRESRIPESSKH